MAKMIRFNNYKVNTETRELYFEGQKVTIQKKSFDLLTYLIQHKQRAVSRDELIQELWSGRAVSDSVLSHASTKLRTALNDNNGKGNFIRTVHGFGLQFVGEIQKNDSGLKAKPAINIETKPQKKEKTLHFIVISFVIICAIILVILYKQFFKPEPTKAIEAISVVKSNLPKVTFINANQDQTKHKWQQQGLTVYLNQILHYTDQSMMLPNAKNVSDFYQVDNIIKMQQNNGALSLTYVRHGSDSSKLSVDLNNLQNSIATIKQWICRDIIQDNNQCEAKLLTLTTDDAYVIESYVRGRSSLIDGSLEQAKNYLQVCIEQDPDFVLARLALSEAFYGVSDYQTAISHAQVVLQISANQTIKLKAQTIIGKSYFRLAEFKKALDAFNSILKSEFASNVQESIALYEMAKIYNTLQNPQKAYDLASQSKNIASELALPISIARALSIMGDIKLSQGDLVLAEQHLLASLKIFEQLNYELGIEYILSPLGIVMESQGKYDASLAYAKQRKEIAKKLGDPISIAGTHLHLANLLIKMGNLKQAESHASQMWDIVVQLDEPQALLAAYYIAAEVAYAQSNFQLSLDKYTLALNISQEAGIKENEVDLLCAMGKVAIDSIQFDLAESKITQCHKSSIETNNKLYQATSKLYLAQLYLAKGQIQQALLNLNFVLKALEKNPNNELLFQTSLTYFDLYIESNIEKAMQYLSNTPQVFQQDYEYKFAKALYLMKKNNNNQSLQLFLEAKQIAKSRWKPENEDLLNQIKNQLVQINQ